MKKAPSIVGILLAIALPTFALGEDLSTGLIAHYTFDGNAVDSSGNANNASPGGSYAFIPGGRTGGAIRINGDGALFYSGGGYIGLPQFGAELNQGLTISFWVKDEAIGQNPVGEEAYVVFGALDLPQIGLHLNRNNPAAPSIIGYLDPIGGPTHPGMAYFQKSIPDFSAFASAWKHFVLVYAPGRFAVFLNGEKLGEANVSFSGFPVATAAMGRHWWNGGGSSSARMSASYDDVFVFKRALSDTAVGQMYSGIDPCATHVAELEAEIALLEAEKAQLQQQLTASQATVASLQTTTNLITTSLWLLQADMKSVFRDPTFILPGATLSDQIARLVEAVIAQNRGQKQGVYKELKK